MESINLHRGILNIIKDDVSKIVYARGHAEPAIDDNSLLIEIFKNYRFTGNNDKGLRLTYLGNKMLSRHYDSYAYKLAVKPTHKAFVALDTYMNWPYYVSSMNIVFYNKDDAAWYKLNGENLNNFVDFL